MDREKKIVEIREALERATPGRWIYDETVGDVYSEKTDEIICCADVNDAHLIANAPEWLRFLLSELDREREENRKLLEERDEARSKAEEAWKEIDSLERLREERDKLIEVLRWYANPKHWYGDETFCPPEGISTEEDCGQRARDILKDIGVTVE